MSSDVYTKAVLTVIALCLVWLSFGGPSRFETVKAADGTTHVVIDGWTAAGRVVLFAEKGGAGLPVSSR